MPKDAAGTALPNPTPMTTDSNSQVSPVELAFRQYSNALQMALADFQYIEECLRLYISVAYDLIRHETSKHLPFKFDASDLDRDALGRLIDKYAKFSNNTILVSALREILPRRNEIAHRGLLLSSAQQHDIAFLDEQTQRLAEMHSILRPYIQTLLNERAALTGEPTVVI